MTSLEPRKPYTTEELQKLYPEQLQLQLVQVLLRHGERSPVSPRFRNAGLTPYWPYCTAARQLRSLVLSDPSSSEWSSLSWRRRLETFGPDDGPTVAAGPKGEYDSVCQPGELTDRGRETTLALGQRLRHLYVEQLGFMPERIGDADLIYLRATPIPRALESVQQAFVGFYPTHTRAPDFPPPTILARSPADEVLYPNDSICRRFAQLSRAYAQRAAERWNDTEEMAYLNRKIGKWMPESTPRVAVDGKPRLSGVMDTINATLAHGPATRLPKEFYDKKGRDIIDRISVEEWFAGYSENLEYRTLGIGALMGDIVSRMVGSVQHTDRTGILEVGGENGRLGVGRGGEREIKFAMSGCHDTTLAAVLHSLGAQGGESWPPYTSHVAIELFRRRGVPVEGLPPVAPPKALGTEKGWWVSLFGSSTAEKTSEPALRRRVDDMSTAEKEKLDGYFVRLRYNDKIMQVPGCREAGKHLDGEESFCTLEAFKAIVDKYTPKDWKAECTMNLDKSAIPVETSPAGY